MDINLRAKYLINDTYNAYYTYSRNIGDKSAVSVYEMTNINPSKKHAAPFMTVWLKNISRIITKAGIDTSRYDFIDVGCGKGISTIFASDQYNFRTVSGFDFEPSLVDAARANHENCKLNHKKITFFVADASEYIIMDAPFFVFMFNPFGSEVLRSFLENNIQSFRKNNTIIGYANARELNVFNAYSPSLVQIIDGYNCAVIRF